MTCFGSERVSREERRRRRLQRYEEDRALRRSQDEERALSLAEDVRKERAKEEALRISAREAFVTRTMQLMEKVRTEERAARLRKDWESRASEASKRESEATHEGNELRVRVSFPSMTTETGAEKTAEDFNMLDRDPVQRLYDAVTLRCDQIEVEPGRSLFEYSFELQGPPGTDVRSLTRTLAEAGVRDRTRFTVRVGDLIEPLCVVNEESVDLEAWDRDDRSLA
jgi:hypothetical protein